MTIDNLQASMMGNDWLLEGNGTLAEHAALHTINGRRDHGLGELVWRGQEARFPLSEDERGRRWYTGLANAWILKPDSASFRWTPDVPAPVASACELLIVGALVAYRVNRSLPWGIGSPDELPPGAGDGGYVCEFWADGEDVVAGGTWHFSGLRVMHFGEGSLDEGPGQVRVYGQRVVNPIAWARSA